jgi:hypothetical protein
VALRRDGSRRRSPTWRGGRCVLRPGAGRCLAGAPQDGSDARCHLARAEGLDDVVVGAELEPDDLVGLLAPGGEHDDRDARLPPELAAHVVARTVREHHVEEDEVGGDAAGEVERLGDGARDLRVEALAGEGLCERDGDGLLVLHHQDGAPALHGGLRC